MTFVLSIEPVDGETYQHGFHLGTDERVARELAVERFQALAKSDKPARTVALMRDRRIFDVYDGEWSSARDY